MRRPRPVVLAAAAGAAVVVLIIWWVALWSPRNRAYNDLASQAQTADAQVSQLQARVDRLKSANIPQLNNELSTLRSAIPDQPQLDQIILDINTAANASGVVLQSISPAPPAGAGASASSSSSSSSSASTANAPARINVSIACSGGYYQIIDFVNRLNALSRLVVVDSLNLGPGSSGGGGGAVSELTAALTTRFFVSQVTPTSGLGTGTSTGAPTASTTTTTTASTASTTTTPASPTTVAGSGR